MTAGVAPTFDGNTYGEVDDVGFRYSYCVTPLGTEPGGRPSGPCMSLAWAWGGRAWLEARELLQNDLIRAAVVVRHC